MSYNKFFNIWVKNENVVPGTYGNVSLYSQAKADLNSVTTTNLAIGKDNSEYNLDVNGTSYFNGAMVANDSITVNATKHLYAGDNTSASNGFVDIVGGSNSEVKLNKSDLKVRGNTTLGSTLEGETSSYSHNVYGKMVHQTVLPESEVSVYTNNKQLTTRGYVDTKISDEFTDRTTIDDVANKIVLRDGSGNILAITQNSSTNNKTVATTAFVQTAISNLINAAPGALDTLKEIAESLNNDPSLASNLTASIALKAPIESPSFTGTVTINDLDSVGVVHTDALGALSTSFIVNADVASDAAIADTKLATISTAGKVLNSATTATSTNTASAIVARDSNGAISVGALTSTSATVSGLNSIGVVHNDAFGTLSTSLIVNADVASNAAIADTKLATISTSGKVLNSATTATSTNTASAIVARDQSGAISVGALTSTSATVSGLNVAGLVHNNASGVLSTSLLVNADVASNAAIADTKLATISTAGKVSNSATTATSSNTANAIVARDANGGFTASTINTTNANATTITTTNLYVSSFETFGVVHNDDYGAFSTSLIVNNDVDDNAAIADTKLATISTAGKVLNSATTATSANTANAIVARDANGAVSVGSATITGLNVAGLVHNNASGVLSTSLLVNADVASNAAIADTKLGTIFTAGKVLNSATTASVSNTPDAIVLRDTSGNYSAGEANLQSLVVANNVTLSQLNSVGVVHNNANGLLSTSLLVNADVASNAAIADTKLATISTSGKVLNSATTATSSNTANAIVARDANGAVSVGALSSTSATVSGLNSVGVVHNDANGVLSTSLLVNADVASDAAIADTKLATISTAGKVLNSATSATSANSANAIITRDASGNFSAGEADLLSLFVYNDVTVDSFTTAGLVHNDANGLLSTSLLVNADVASDAAIADTKLATISTAGKVANSATTATTSSIADTIVLRDASGNISQW